MISLKQLSIMTSVIPCYICTSGQIGVRRMHVSCVLCVALHNDTNCITHYGQSRHGKRERYSEETVHISIHLLND